MPAGVIRWFKRHALLANVASASILFGTGDVAAQKLARSADGAHDYRRTGRAVLFGTVFAAPVGYKWYQLILRIDTGNFYRDVALRVAADQTVFGPIVSLPAYFGIMSVLEGRKPVVAAARARVEQQWWPTLVKSWSVWPVFQAMNFLVVPVPFQLLSVNVFSLGWTCYLSMRNARSS